MEHSSARFQDLTFVVPVVVLNGNVILTLLEVLLTELEVSESLPAIEIMYSIIVG